MTVREFARKIRCNGITKSCFLRVQNSHGDVARFEPEYTDSIKDEIIDCEIDTFMVAIKDMYSLEIYIKLPDTPFGDDD